MSTLYVVPARGGSQRIPRKALAPVCGRPLIWYTIDYLRQLDLLPESCCVTDDDEIGRYCEANGLRAVYEPPVKLENCERAVRFAVMQEAEWPDTVAIVEPTAPVRTLGLVQRVRDGLTKAVDASVACVRCPPPELILRPEPDMTSQCWTFCHSHLLRPAYVFSGALHFFHGGIFRHPTTTMGEFWHARRVRIVEQTEPHLDIDTPEQLLAFELLIRTGQTLWTPADE